MTAQQPQPAEHRPARGVAVVTGGSAGVGRAVVKRLAERGYDVAVLARGTEGLEAAAAEVRAAGRRGLAVPVDVADADEVERAAERVTAELGDVDVWVNNAFAGSIAFFSDVTAEEYERITSVTYLGYVNGTRAALARMRPRGRGTVVQVGSALAYRGIPLQAAYCGAKHAIVGFTESVRAELLHERSGVELCMVHLPGINTPQFDWVLHRGVEQHPQPVAPIFQPEVAARAVVHMVEHPRRSMWVGLPTVATILGNRVAPGLLDWFLARTNVDAQQVDGVPPDDREPNLFRPRPGDAGAHGSFDHKAFSRSPALWVSRHRAASIAAVTAVGATAVAVLGRRAS